MNTVRFVLSTETGWIHSRLSTASEWSSKIQLDTSVSDTPLLKSISSLSALSSPAYSSQDQPFIAASFDGVVSIYSPSLLQLECAVVPVESPLITCTALYNLSNDNFSMFSLTNDGSLYRGEELLSQLPLSFSKPLPLLPGLPPMIRAFMSVSSSKMEVTTAAEHVEVYSIHESEVTKTFHSKQADKHPLTHVRPELFTTDIVSSTFGQKSIVIASSSRGSVHIFDPLAQSKPQHILVTPHLTNVRVNCLKVVDDFTFLSGDSTGAINIWDLRKTTAPLRKLKGAMGSVKSINLIDDVIACVDLDQRLTFWRDYNNRTATSVFINDRPNKLLILPFEERSVGVEEGEPVIKKPRLS
ncbi:hypothetical protein RCL1_005025 [Eukaryota sp. TZLM3-RCL]